MNVNLKEALIKYYSLNILSFKEDIDIDKKWLKKLRKKIINFLDTEITFPEFYKILKSVEKENFGFVVKTLIHEYLLPNEKEKVSYQVVNVRVNYIGYSKQISIEDIGYGEVVHETKASARYSKIIKPEEIIAISNINILNAIKRLDKKVYNYVVNIIIEKLYEKVSEQDELDLIVNIISQNVLDKDIITNCRYSFFKNLKDAWCIEKKNRLWEVYYSLDGKIKGYSEKYYHFIEACWDLIDTFDIKNKDLKKKFILELKTI